MAVVQAVNGPLDTAHLGFTLIHEHLRVRSEGVAEQWPHLYDTAAERARAIAQVREAQRHGVATIADPTVMGHGRDVRLMQAVVTATGIQLIAATGLYTYNELPPYFANRPIDALADAFVHDIEQGIQGTSVRAAFLKCATDEPGMTRGVEHVLRAVARAHRRTGAPIMTHSHPASGTGLLQQDVFESEGVDLARVLIGHSGDTTDLDYLERLIARGSFIGMDRYGLERILPTDQRNATVAALCARGHVDHLLLAQDACATLDWYPPESMRRAAPNWTMALVPREVIPALVAAGVTQQQIATMTVANPRRYFERQGAY
jgi:phosphotriesterase-related protein